MRLPSLAYEPYEDLEDRPHVMVDGAARRSSVLTLSHWPQSPTPPGLARDLSAEIVLEYLRLRAADGRGRELGRGKRSPKWARDVIAQGDLGQAVTNDHFDEDGLMSVFGLVDPERSLENAGLVVDVASCGDFGVVVDDKAAQIAFAILPFAAYEAGPGASTGALYRAILPVLPELLERPERFTAHFEKDFAELGVGRAAIARGEVELFEYPESDLCVVRRAASLRLPGAGANGGFPVHQVAINGATSATRIVSFDGDRCSIRLRYEGWVRLVSRKVPLRPDLEPLAAILSAEEPSGLAWEADGVGAIIGSLDPGGEGRTEIAPDRVVELVRQYLGSAPPAWDPFRPGGGFIPISERAGYVQARG